MTDLLADIIEELLNRGIIERRVTPKSERQRCGAKCRDGHSCEAPAVWDKENNRPRNGRCRMHGGSSTGPRTLEGKLRALMNLKQFRALASE